MGNMRNSTRAILGVSALGVVTIFLHSVYYREQYPTWISGQSTDQERFDKDAHDPLKAVRNFRASMPVLRASEDIGWPEGYVDGEQQVGEKPVFNWVQATQMIVFGDSFTTNLWPVREKGPGNGFPTTFVHLEHSVAARTWADWLWSQFTNNFQTKYYNLARRGSTICWDILPPSQKPWGTFDDQVTDFIDFFVKDEIGTPTAWVPETAAFLIQFGINDISHLVRGDGGFDGSKLPVEETCKELVERLFTYTNRLHEAGGRNFVFMNSPPFYRVPKYLIPSQPGYDVAQRATEAVKWFNHYYAIEFERFKDNHSDSNSLLFDLENFMSIVLDYPEIFGLTDTMRWNVVYEDKHEVEKGKLGLMWGDFQHPSWTVHNLIARALNGFLIRHSPVFQASNTTDIGIYVPADPLWKAHHPVEQV